MPSLFKNPFDLFDTDFADASWANIAPGLSDASVATAAVGDLGTLAYGLARGGFGTGSGGHGTGVAAPAPTQVTTSGSGLVIDLVWDSSINSSPSGFTASVIAAAQFLEGQISTAATLTIDVGYDEVGGSALSSGALGESESNIQTVSYAALLTALAKTGSTDATDQSVLASLPKTAPVSGTVWVTTAQAEALGLTSANGASLAGDIGFGPSSEFTYGDTATTGTVAAGTYDFFSTAVHEMTEVMGRIMLVGSDVESEPSYTLLDMLHYSSAGVQDFTQSQPGYFSVDGGITNLGEFNTISGGDPGDWASSDTDNAFDAYATPGVIEAIPAADITEMDALGWNLTAGVTAPTPPSTPPPPPATPPSGISVSPETGFLAYAQTRNGLFGGSPLASVTEVGGTTGDKFTYALSGSGASSFTLTGIGNNTVLSAGGTGVTGSASGTLYALTVTTTDATTGVSSAAAPVNVVVGGGGANVIGLAQAPGFLAALGAGAGAGTASGTIDLASVPGIAAGAPTFIYGLGGNDTIDGAGMTGQLFFDGGAGADTMTGGSGVNDYLYGAAGDSTPSAMDIITNFNASVDRIDLTGLGISLKVAGAITGTTLAAESIGWQVSGGDTVVYVNTGGGLFGGSRTESLTAANMKIELQGTVALTSANFAHD